MWGHLFSENDSIPVNAVAKLIIVCLRKILLDGEKTPEYILSLPSIRSVSSRADTIACVMPHLFYPVVTKRFGVKAEYLPI